MMFKLSASIKKEIRQLLSDKVGLTLLFLMPLLLVIVITTVQDSAYKAVNEHVISLLVCNRDKGDAGTKFIASLEESALFEITLTDGADTRSMREKMAEESALTGLIIPENFTRCLRQKAHSVSDLMMKELEVIDEITENKTVIPELKLYYDPVLQEQYCQSIVNVMNAHVEMMQSSMMVDAVFEDAGLDGMTDKLRDEMLAKKVTIATLPATENQETRPNSTQHNVPAWTIFAMFFMVVALGGNIVNERVKGSFQRLKTMPTSFWMVLFSKMIVYVGVGFLQVLLIFSVGLLLFPLMSLPALTMPSNIPAFVVIVLLSAMAAVSYAMLIGTYSRTQVQANGVGAVTVIIFAALGGVWVPTFIMPPYLQTISLFSPLNWCLEGYYTLFLRGGSWATLLSSIVAMSLFIAFCQVMMVVKLKVEKLL